MKKPYLAVAGIAVFTGAFYMFGAAGCTTTGAKATATPKPTNTPAPTNTPSNTPTNTPVPVPPGMTLPGYIIVAGGSDGAAVVGDAYVGAVDASGNITWTTGPSLGTAVYYVSMGAASASGYVVSASGDSGSSSITDVYAGQVGGGGTISSWTTTMAAPVGKSMPAVANDAAGTMYMAGGYMDYNFTTRQSTVYAASYSGATVSSWSTGSPLPMGMSFGALAYQTGFLFYIGGQTTAGQSTIYRATTSGSTVGSWSAVTPSLPGIYRGGGGFGAGGYLLTFGGADAAALLTTSYRATVSGTGTIGSWSTTNGLPAGRWLFAWSYVPQSFNGYVYVIGGDDGTGPQTLVQSASFSAGTLGSWSANTAYPVAINEQATTF